MHLHPAVSLLVFVALAVATDGSAQDAASSAVAVRTRLLVFTEAEMERFHAIAAEQAARRESYIQATMDDDVILLEPYIVEGDDSLLLARIRRELEGGVLGRQRMFVGISDATRQELMLERRSQDAFFSPASPGRPNDAPAFDGIDLRKLPGKLRPSNLSELFSRPGDNVRQ